MPKFFVQDATIIVRTYEIEGENEEDARERYETSPNRECNTSEPSQEYDLGIFHIREIEMDGGV